MTPELIAIVAMTPARVIGVRGALPWHLPADLYHFRRLSVGKPNIMGRKVYDSLGRRALPDRQNIVLTRQADFTAPGCEVAHDPAAALRAAGNAPEVAVLGGEEIYRLYLDAYTRVELTLVHADLAGDTFFPELPGVWDVTRERHRPADERNAYDLTFRTLVRRT